MLKTRVIPILLYKDGHLVKSIRFSDHRNLGIPMQSVKVYNARNVDELAILDITKTLDGQGLEYATFRDLARECWMPLTLGGGVCSIDHVKQLLQSGADKVSINSVAVAHPSFVSRFARAFGSQCVVVSLDVKKVGDRYHVVTRCGNNLTGLDPASWAREVEKRGAGEILLTSIDHEGTMKGYDLELIRLVSSSTRVPVVANGGAGKLEHFLDAKRAGASAVAASSVFHYTEITPQNVRQFLSDHGVPTRAP
jgi:cyclase